MPTIILHDAGNMKIAEVTGDGVLLRNADDARNLLMQSHRAEWIAVHEKNIDPKFFDLRSGIAGDVLQKFVNYRTCFAILGDVTRYTEKSEALASLVRESNRGKDVRFVATLEALISCVA